MIDDPIRIQIDVSREVNGNLAKLAERTNAESVSDAIRKAIALYDLVITHVENGGTISLQHKVGVCETLRLSVKLTPTAK